MHLFYGRLTTRLIIKNDDRARLLCVNRPTTITNPVASNYNANTTKYHHLPLTYGHRQIYEVSVDYCKLETDEASDQKRIFKMNSRLSNLDCARGFAAFGVVIYHCGFDEWAPWYWGSMDFFFVLSGILITKSLIELRQRNGTLLDFLIYRAARLLPVMLIILIGYELAIFALNSPLYPIEIEHNRKNLDSLRYLFLAQNTDLMIYGEQTFRRIPELVHFWSLMLEEQFYLAWGMFIFTFFKRNLTVTPKILILMLCLILTSTLYRYHGGHLWTIAGRLDGFVIGTFVGMVIYGEVTDAVRKALKVCRSILPGLFAISFGWLVFSGLNLYSYEGKYLEHPTAWIDVTTFSIFSAFLIIKLMRTNNDRSNLPATLRALNYLGLISYELYVVHMPVVKIIGRVIEQGTIQMNIVIALTTLTISIPLAHVLHNKVTQPALKHRKSIAKTAANEYKKINDGVVRLVSAGAKEYEA